MRILALVAGILCIFIVLLDAFQTIILPRRATGRFRLTRIFYIVTWNPWVFFARRLRNPRKRETVLSYYGPLSLILLLVVWAAVMVARLRPHLLRRRQSLQRRRAAPPTSTPTSTSAEPPSSLSASATSRRTVPGRAPSSFSSAAPASAFSPSSWAISRSSTAPFPAAKSASRCSTPAPARRPPPPSSCAATPTTAPPRRSPVLLVEWERWSAELLESHISYPLLCYFRSQHNNQSWLSALTAILDASSLLIAGVRGLEARQAQLTFAMARHALVDLSQIFSLRPVADAPDRLPPDRCRELYDMLSQSGIELCYDESSRERLRQMRALYERYAEALSRFLLMPLPQWFSDQPRKDNWQTVARLRAQTEATDADSPIPPPPDSVRPPTQLSPPPPSSTIPTISENPHKAFLFSVPCSLPTEVSSRAQRAARNAARQPTRCHPERRSPRRPDPTVASILAP